MLRRREGSPLGEGGRGGRKRVLSGSIDLDGYLAP